MCFQHVMKPAGIAILEVTMVPRMFGYESHNHWLIIDHKLINALLIKVTV